jgi:hypothetical protein
MSEIIKEYDFIISLGRFCHTSAILNNNGLKIVDGPFDWSGTAHESTIYNRIKRLHKGFKHYFDKKDFYKFADDKTDLYQDWYLDAVRPITVASDSTRMKSIREDAENAINTDIAVGYYNTREHTYFVHDWQMNKDFDSQFDTIRKKYMRRIERTLNYIKNSNRILLCYMNHIGDQRRDLPLESTKVVRIMNKLRQKFPGKTIDLYMFDHDPSFSGEHFRRDVLDVGIIRYVSNHDDVFPSEDTNPKHIADGLMMPKSICYILSKIKLTDKHKMI